MGFLETLIIVGGGIALKEGVTWLFNRRAIKKLPEPLRAGGKAIAIAGATAALKKFADEVGTETPPPPVPSARGKK